METEQINQFDRWGNCIGRWDGTVGGIENGAFYKGTFHNVYKFEGFSIEHYKNINYKKETHIRIFNENGNVQFSHLKYVNILNEEGSIIKMLFD